MSISHRQGAQPVSQVLAELFSRRGFARLRSQERIEEAWREAAGTQTSRHTRVAVLRGGVLEVLVKHSVLLQELSAFQRAGLVERLRSRLGTSEIRDIRFRLDATI